MLKVLYQTEILKGYEHRVKTIVFHFIEVEV